MTPSFTDFASRSSQKPKNLSGDLFLDVAVIG
jgi:hypothetical protein